MRVASCALLAFLLLGIDSVPNVDTLVADHIQGLGGIARIHAIHSFIKYGTYDEDDLHLGNTFTAQMRPFYRVIGDPRTDPTAELHEGYDGSAWEYYPDPGIVVRTVGEAARAARHTAMFDDPLVDYASHRTAITYGGTRQYHGFNVYVLHVTLADGFREDYFLDRGTYMLDGRAQFVPMHAFGTRYATDDVYGDYRPEGGIMFAHTDAEIDSSSGKTLDSGTVTRMEINPDLPLSMFSPPQWTRTPLQAMIQSIYDERDESVAVMATYRDFSALLDEHAAAAGDAVDFAGYQCLKMGHADVAVALLRQNVADHPKSARAHFGLGRAAAAEGNRSLAQQEFREALEIDPNFARARTALDALH